MCPRWTVTQRQTGRVAVTVAAFEKRSDLLIGDTPPAPPFAIRIQSLDTEYLAKGSNNTIHGHSRQRICRQWFILKRTKDLTNSSEEPDCYLFGGGAGSWSLDLCPVVTPTWTKDRLHAGPLLLLQLDQQRQQRTRMMNGYVMDSCRATVDL